MSEAAASLHLIYSCDDHLDIYHLPADLWTTRLPEKYRELGPRVVERDGRKWWVAGDHSLGLRMGGSRQRDRRGAFQPFKWPASAPSRARIL